MRERRKHLEFLRQTAREAIWSGDYERALTLYEEGLSIARPGGRVLLFAHNEPVLQLSFPAAAVGIEEKEILGSYSASVDEQQESAALVFSGKLPLRDLISHRFPLERIADALDLAAHPKQDTLKVAITHE